MAGFTIHNFCFINVQVFKIILDFANILLGIYLLCLCVCLSVFFVFAMCTRFVHNPTQLLYDTAVFFLINIFFGIIIVNSNSFVICFRFYYNELIDQKKKRIIIFVRAPGRRRLWAPG